MMQIAGPCKLFTSLHFAIFEDGGTEFLLDIADAVEVISRRVRGTRAGVWYKRAGFAGTGCQRSLLVEFEVIRTKSMWS